VHPPTYSLCEHSVLVTDSPTTRSECRAMQVWKAIFDQPLGAIIIIFLSAAQVVWTKMSGRGYGAIIFPVGTGPLAPPLSPAPAVPKSFSALHTLS